MKFHYILEMIFLSMLAKVDDPLIVGLLWVLRGQALVFT